MVIKSSLPISTGFILNAPSTSDRKSQKPFTSLSLKPNASKELGIFANSNSSSIELKQLTNWPWEKACIFDHNINTQYQTQTQTKMQTHATKNENACKNMFFAFV